MLQIMNFLIKEIEGYYNRDHGDEKEKINFKI